VGVYALPSLILLASSLATAEAYAAFEQGAPVRVPPPSQPLDIKPVPLGSIDVVGEEPRFVAPTRRDRIGRIWAPVTINGQGPFRLVLATGASHSALTPHLVEALGIRGDPADTVMLRGATGSATVPMVPIEMLEVGDLLMEPRRLAVIPDALGGADGVLGMDELADMRILIEFRRDRITIMRSKNQRAGGQFQTIPVGFLNGRLLAVDATMGGVPVKAIIDTGSQTTLGNAALREALAEKRRQEMLEGKLDQVVGSTLDMQVGTRLGTPSLRLGPVTVRSPATTFADFEIFKHWKMTDEPAMLIGMDVIGLLDTLIIDYRRRELQVRLPRVQRQ
jgi:hypothetical protein